jgi:hypothetical protein
MGISSHVVTIVKSLQQRSASFCRQSPTDTNGTAENFRAALGGEFLHTLLAVGGVSGSGSRVDLRPSVPRGDRRSPWSPTSATSSRSELWTRDALHVERLLFAGNSLDKARERFAAYGNPTAESPRG